MAKFKALTRKGSSIDWRWQENGFEHRLRPSESIEDYGFYIFMNAYQGGRLPLTEKAPGWICPDEKKFLFLGKREEMGGVPQEWLAEAVAISKRISVDL